jgi:hypothetical protein
MVRGAIDGARGRRTQERMTRIQVTYNNSPKTKLTSPVKNFTMHNAYDILSQSDNPIPDDKTLFVDCPHHNRMPMYANTAGNARSHGASISN